MDENLIKLRQRVIAASLENIRAQRVYLRAASIFAEPELQLEEAAEKYLKAAALYDAALQNFREYLIAAKPSETIDVELDHTERFIEALGKEIKAALKLIERRIKLACSYAEEEEE